MRGEDLLRFGQRDRLEGRLSLLNIRSKLVIEHSDARLTRVIVLLE